jgi:hypothetical protein
MFAGLCAAYADLVAILGILVIVGFEGPGIVRAQFSRWRMRSNTAGDFFVEMVHEVAPGGVPAEADGLVDKVPTEKIPVSEWLRGDLKDEARKPESKPERKPELVPVPAGGRGGSEAPDKVRPSVREKRR